MLALKYLLMILGVGLFGSAGSLVVYDVFISEQLRRLLARNKTSEAGTGTETGIGLHHAGDFRDEAGRIAFEGCGCDYDAARERRNPRARNIAARFAASRGIREGA